MSIEPSIPLPLEPTPPPEADQRRLWIGNIDNRLTEYNLLKIVQKFGQIKNFDFLFHKSGALKGQPRGYSFVTFETRKQAETALAELNGKTILGKTLAAKWAHTIPSEISPSQKSAASATKAVEEAKQTKNTIHQIMEIEAKLSAMEDQRENELEMCLSSVPVSEHNPLLMHRRVQHKPRPYHRRK